MATMLNNRQHLETEQKALEINLDANIYGSFAEIGAGQEVARYFFKAGAAAGTIAKTISAYDKVVSDDIYGRESTGRYVCESRLYRMLDHEYELMMDRLSGQGPELCLFAFADTMSTINYHRTNHGQGWMGMRFQLVPHSEPNDIIIHVELLDNNTDLQQQAVGILGVNLIHACYRYADNYKNLLNALIDRLRDRIRIDFVRISGPQFLDLDNRLVLLELIRQNMTDVVLFDKKGVAMHVSEFIYKKNMLVVRGNYRPTTLVSMDMIRSSSSQFRSQPGINPIDTYVVSEITLDSLCSETGDIDETDFIDRANLLNHMGQTIMITNCDRYKKLINYLMAYKMGHLGIVMESSVILSLINGKYERNLDGRLLTSMGEIFTRGVTFYAFPELKEGSGELMTLQNLPIPDGFKHLYAYLLEHNHIVDVTGFNEQILHIRTSEVLRKLREDEDGWEQLVPDKVARFIRENGTFGYPMEKLQFDY